MGLLDLFSSSGGIAVGDRAPDFALPDRNGKTIRLADFH